MYAMSFELNLMIMFLYYTNMIYYNLSDWIVCYHVQRHFFLLFHHPALHSLSILASSGSNSDSASSSPRDMGALPKKIEFFFTSREMIFVHHDVRNGLRT